MLKKRLGAEATERNWFYTIGGNIKNYFKIPTSIIIPEGCMRIGDRVFKDCNSLEEVSIPESVELIGYASFSDCVGLKKVEIPRSVERIGFHAFWGCRKATIILRKPESEFSGIGWHAFYSVRYVKEEIRS